MKIAIPYDNGNVFGHFGKTEQFRVYEAENGKILSASVLGTDGTGHEALAELLKKWGVQVLICGGIGGGALSALDAAGIQVISGAEGNADEAAEKWLRGELESTGSVCDHHHEEERSCGGGCGHCPGHCERSAIQGKNVGKTCRVHYRGTFNDGTQFDSSFDRGEPLQFVCGAGQMISGFDAAAADMEVGEEKDVHLMPSEAYGEKNPNMILRAKIADLPGAEELSVGDRVYLSGPGGQPIPVTVTEKDDENITLDANHEMAGKELNFHIKMVEIL